MKVLDHMMLAEAQMLLADELTRPETPEAEASAHLHTAMVHLEAAISIAQGKQQPIPDLLLKDE